MKSSLINPILKLAKPYYCELTRFLHFHPQTPEGENHRPIPTIENALYALALCRSHERDEVIKGLALIDSILPFQIRDGSFPCYLHQYPTNLDGLIGLDLLPSFYWILHDYHSVLGAQRSAALRASAEKLLKFTQERMDEIAPPPHLKQIYGIIQSAFGSLWNDSALENRGNSLLATVQGIDSLLWKERYTPDVIGRIALISEMVGTNPLLKEAIIASWHPNLNRYVGPIYRGTFHEGEMVLSLVDLLFGQINRTPKHNSHLPTILRGVWLKEVWSKLPSTDSNVEQTIHSGPHGVIWSGSDYAIAAFDGAESIEPSQASQFFPLQYFWSTPHSEHSFVLQGPTHSIHPKKEGNILRFEIDLPEELPEDDREKSYELNFFITRTSNLTFNVAEGKSTTFHLNEKIQFVTPTHSCTVKINLLSGSGRFIGHIMRGNRPSESGAKGSKRYEAWDWNLILRTLERDIACRLAVEIEFN